MNVPLPDSITCFFKLSNSGGASATVEECFADNAIVRDEHRTHQGHEAIRIWLRDAQQKYTYTTEPLDFVEHDSDVTVRTRVSGNFPGSPIELDHLFTLSGCRIESLEIR